MDNAGFHKGKEMQEILFQAGHVLEYLLPYSPDLNNIEKKMGSMDKSLRKKYIRYYHSF